MSDLSIMKDDEDSLPIGTAISRWAQRAFKAESELDRLRVEMEGVRQAAAVGRTVLRKEIDSLRAENEQLRIDKITLGNFGALPNYRSQETELDRLRAENAEMRNWLKAIVNMVEWDGIRVILAKAAKEEQ